MISATIVTTEDCAEPSNGEYSLAVTGVHLFTNLSFVAEIVLVG